MPSRLFLILGCLLLGAQAASAQPRWTIVTSETLTVIGDQSPSKLREIADHLEHFREVVGGLFSAAGRPPSLPIVVYVFGTNKTMEAYLPLANGKPWDVAGLAASDGEVNRILISLESYAASSLVAYHEYTHVLVRNATQNVPLWMNEGLAEFYSTYALLANRKQADIGRTIPWHLDLLRERWLPVSELLQIDSSMEEESQRRSLLYAESWLLAHYLMVDRKDNAAALNKYANAYAAGRSPAEASVEAFGMTLEQLNETLRRYARKQIFSMYRFTFDERIARRAVAPARTLTATEADGWLGDLQRANNRVEGTPRIEAAAARDAGSAMVHLALARLRHGEGKTTEALAAFGKAAQLAPDDFTVQWARARAIVMAGSGGDGGSAALLEPARRAATLRPDSSDAQALFAFAALQEGELAAARTAIEKAINLSPGRLDYRIRLAEVLWRLDMTPSAKAILSGVAAVKTDSRSATTAASLLAAIASREEDIARARAALAAVPSESVTAGGTSPLPPSPPVRATTTPPVRLAGSGVSLSELSGRSSVRVGDVTLQLRSMGPDEVRALGRLTRVDCATGAVRFALEIDGRAVTFSAAKMEDVELVQFSNDAMTLRCGARTPPDIVYVTWRPAAGAATATVVAVEFMPPAFKPQ